MDTLTKDNLIKTWRRDGFRLELYDLNKRVDSHWMIGYRFFDHKTLIFEGLDYGSSPMYAIDSIESIYGLLGFLSCRPGDTDDEYFESYTQRQLDWVNSDRCEVLSNYVYDWEERRYKR